MTWLAQHDGSLGRSAVFSDAAIKFCLTIKVLCKWPLQQGSCATRRASGGSVAETLYGRRILRSHSFIMRFRDRSRRGGLTRRPVALHLRVHVSLNA